MPPDPRSHKIGCQATQTVYEFAVLVEYAKINKLMEIITDASGGHGQCG